MKKPERAIKSPTVLVISSHVVRGTVGNRAAVFALETLGHAVWALPTITLPWHPGHGPGTRIVASNDEFAGICSDIANAPWRQEIGAVITGFMANCEQVKIAADLIERLQQENSGLVYMCDPVIGDIVPPAATNLRSNSGRLYVDEAVALAILKHMLPLADITTPNLFELSWLSDSAIASSPEQATNQARTLCASNVLVTSVPGRASDTIGNLVTQNGRAIMSEHKIIANPPNGLGDLTSALFLSHLLRGHEIEIALAKTTASVYDVLRNTAKRGANELALESNQVCLQKPAIALTISRLG